MKLLRYTIFAAILLLGTTRSSAMEDLVPPNTTATVSNSEALNEDAKRLVYWTACVGVGTVQAALFAYAISAVLSNNTPFTEARYFISKSMEFPYLSIRLKETAFHTQLAAVHYGSLAGLNIAPDVYRAVLAVDSVGVLSKWLPKALYPWSGLTKLERAKAFALSAGAAASVISFGFLLSKICK